MAEKLAFDQIFGNGRAIHLHQVVLRPPRALVQRFRDLLFSRPGLSGDQNGRFAPGHFLNDHQDLLHLRTFGDELTRFAFYRLQDLQLPCLPLVIEGPHDFHLELVELERLLNVVIGPEAHRLDRRFDRSVGRHDHDDSIFVSLLRLPEDLQPIRLRHLHVGDHQVEVLLVQPANRLAAIGRRFHVVTVLAEHRLEVFSRNPLVLDDEKTFHRLTPDSSFNWTSRVGQLDGKGGSSPRLAFHVDKTSMGIDDLLGHRQPDSRPPRLGGEKGKEHPRAGFGRDAPAGIPDAHHGEIGRIILS
jgi:hypothetical protein